MALMAVATGLPQGSPVSPVLFALYIADIHQAVESQVEDSRGISFVDDVTWIVEGYDLDDVAGKLERCAAASLEWAEHNAVRFETTKTEAILFSRRRRHRRTQRGIRVGGETVRFAPEDTRWLGIWLDSALTPREPAAKDWQGTPGRGKVASYRQPVRSPPRVSKNALHVLGAVHDAVWSGAHVEWSEGSRGRVSESGQQDG